MKQVSPTAIIGLIICLVATSTISKSHSAEGNRGPDWQEHMMIFLQPKEAPASYETSGGFNWVHHTYWPLDISYSTELHAAKMGLPEVHLAPSIVCGEGDDPENGTLVRVLSHYQLVQSQFSAFPNAKGGVHVAALRSGGRHLIAAAPMNDSSIRSVRIFDDWGVPVAQVSIPENITPPFVIATGRFLGGEEEIIAVASRDAKWSATYVALVTGDGQVRRTVVLPRQAAIAGENIPAFGRLQLSTRYEPGRDLIMAYSLPTKSLVLADVSDVGLRVKTIALPDLDEHSTVYDSVFPGQAFVAADNDDQVLSHVRIIDDASNKIVQDVGRRENTFFGNYTNKTGKYVMPGGYGMGSEAPGAPGHAVMPKPWEVVRKTNDGSVLRSNNPSDWLTGTRGCEPLSRATVLYPFWSHWHNSWFGNHIGDIKDAATGASLYNWLDADDKTMGDGAIFKGDISIDRQLLLASREYFWVSARNVRGPNVDAEKLIGLTSLHELGQKIDYNPGNLKTFRDYEHSRWGTIARLNARFGTSFPDFDAIDPPRGKDRGPWDAVPTKDKRGQPSEIPDDSFYVEWRDYNRLIVFSTRWVDATRDGLLAGYAPELMKNHRPGFGKDMSIAGLTMGTSTGGSVYSPLPGVDHERVIVTAVNSSGQWNFSYGEYQEDEDPAYEYVRIKWQWKQGLITVSNAPHHRMVEEMLGADGEPRPGQTGGVGQVRGAMLKTTEGEIRFHIAQIGVGGERNGLLKSLTDHGTWEGSVYVVPFHAKVVTQPLTVGWSNRGPTADQFGPVPLLSHNDQVAATFEAIGQGKVTLSLSHGGVVLPESVHAFESGKVSHAFRYVVRNQMLLRDVRLHVNIEGSAVVKEFEATAHMEQVARHGKTFGVQHRGGVSFDLLDRDTVARRQTATPLALAPDVKATLMAPDRVPPTWVKPSLTVRYPLDDEIKAVGWLPCIDPDYRTWLIVSGARDNDDITRFRIYDVPSGRRLVETSDATPRIPLPPLPPLTKCKLRVTAVDRAGNESRDSASIEFLTPAIFDFGEATTCLDQVIQIGTDARMGPDKPFGWAETNALRSKNMGWGKNTLTSCLLCDVPATFSVRAPQGAYRIVPMIGTSGGKERYESFTVGYGGKTTLNYYVRDWTANVEPFVARTIGEKLAITMPAKSRLFGLVITPARATTPPDWPDRRATVTYMGYELQPEEGRTPASYRLDRAELRVEWPPVRQVTQIRHYRVRLDGAVTLATNLTYAQLRNLPVDKSISLRVDAVDYDGNVTEGETITAMLDTRLTGFVSASTSFPMNDSGTLEAWLNGKPLSFDSRMRLPAVGTFRTGKNVLAVRVVQGAVGPKLRATIEVGDRRLTTGTEWRVMSQPTPNWQAVDYDDAGWSIARTLDVKPFYAYGADPLRELVPWIAVPSAQKTPKGTVAFFRYAFNVSGNSRLSANAQTSSQDDPKAITSILDKIVIQNADWNKIPLNKVVLELNAAIEQNNTTGIKIKIIAADIVAGKQVTLNETNQTIRSVLERISRQTGTQTKIARGGMITLAP